MLRAKPPDAVRRDALRMAQKKFAEGCTECGMGYLAVAEDHGASDEELARVAGWVDRRLSRRDIMKLGAASAAAILARNLLSPTPAFATTYYWGSDTNTASCTAIPTNFYIGRSGYGLTENWNYFNLTAANRAGVQNTYTYWDLEGPGARPSNISSDYAWGQAQANKANAVWTSGKYASYTYGRTIFADIEGGNLGSWSTYHGSRDQNVLRGWLDQMDANFSHDGFGPGVYISPSNWTTYFGSSYKPATPFTLWLTGCQTRVTCNPGTGSTCACDPRSRAESLWNTYASQTILGGCKAVLWQYFTTPDLNVTTDNPYAWFSIWTSSTTYHNPGC